MTASLTSRFHNTHQHSSIRGLQDLFNVHHFWYGRAEVFYISMSQEDNVI